MKKITLLGVLFVCLVGIVSAQSIALLPNLKSFTNSAFCKTNGCKLEESKISTDFYPDEWLPVDDRTYSLRSSDLIVTVSLQKKVNLHNISFKINGDTVSKTDRKIIASLLQTISGKEYYYPFSECQAASKDVNKQVNINGKLYALSCTPDSPEMRQAAEAYNGKSLNPTMFFYISRK